MAKNTWKTIVSAEKKTLAQLLVIDTENLANRTVDLIKANKKKTVTEIVNVILNDPMSDAPRINVGTDDEKALGISAITSVKKGKKPTEVQTAYKKWSKMTPDERKNADQTFFFVKAAASFKANATRDYERSEATGLFKFQKNGEPVPRIKKTGNDNTKKKIELDVLNKAVQTRFNEVRTNATAKDLAFLRGYMLKVYGDLDIEKLPIPEITGSVK